LSAVDSLVKALKGDKSTEVIKAGALATTRASGSVALGLIGVFAILDVLDVGPWEGFSSEAKFQFVLGTGALWAVLAAADSIARAIATAAVVPSIIRLPAGMTASYTIGIDSPGWMVVAAEITPGGADSPTRYLLYKDDKTMWASAPELKFESSVPPPTSQLSTD
jgi:hypothetical protein